jgi:hypothetical protein
VFHVGEGEMGDFMVFWVCFMVEKDREKRRSLTAGEGRGRWM